MADSASISGAAVPPGQGPHDGERTAPMPLPADAVPDGYWPVPPPVDAVPDGYWQAPGQPGMPPAGPGRPPGLPAELVETRALPVIEDGIPRSFQRGGGEGTAVLRAVTPSPATAVLRAVPQRQVAGAGAAAGAVEPELPPGPADQGGQAVPPRVSTGWTATIPLPDPHAGATDGAGQARVSTGWTGTVPLPDPNQLAAPATGGVYVGSGLRGRILAIEGGYGAAGRRGWGRGGSGQPQVLSAMLAAVAPQTLLAAESVDAVHLPAAADPQTVLAHLRAAARHPGPLLVHVGGQLVADKRGGGLHLTLRDSKAGTVRQDGVAWSAIVGELRARPADWDTLVIADLSADQGAWPMLQGGGGPALQSEEIPLWAVVGPDAEQIGIFTRALIETLHHGRPGAGPLLTPEELRGQVHSVLRPTALIFNSYGPDRAVFRNNARRQAAVVPETPAAPQVAAEPAVVPAAAPGAAPEPVPDGATAATVPLPRPPAERGPVSLLKPGVPLTVRPIHPVSLAKAGVGAEQVVVEQVEAVAVELADVVPAPVSEPAVAAPVAAPPVDAAPVDMSPVDAVPVDTPPAEAAPVDAVPADTPPAQAAPEPAAPTPVTPPEDYREALGLIVRTADAGEHDAAAELALALEEQVVVAHGAIAPPVLMVRQVRAHVARLAGDPVLAAELYRQVALVLLAVEGPEDPEAQRVATNAEACWRAIPDARRARQIGPLILELRAQLPGEDGRKLRSAERYLAKLTAAVGQPPTA
ncbi:hypothetical protein [Kitasatospora sp. LaBMicrA B282]|uniref:hypothetical protein n=1 Tax=Kitasatospora sp. LaBMicrA B282 TaxID=3420949 RepID=UPI003D14DA9B